MTNATRKMRLILKLMNTHISTERIMLNGALTDMRMSIWKAFCKLDTSVVIRVISPEVENLSMLANENVWMLRYMASRRLYANPVEAFAEQRPDRMPKSSEKAAIKSISPP